MFHYLRRPTLAPIFESLAGFAHRTTDSNDPDSPVDFTSLSADRLTETEVEMLMPADLVSLPKGQAFALIEGGRLYKLRLPLAGDDPLLPEA